MRWPTVRFGLLAILVTGGVTGFPESPRLRADARENVTKVFQAFQAALKAGDAGKTYALLDSASQAAADRTARLIRTAVGKATDAQKAQLVKTLGLPAGELARLTGVGFLRTKRFRAKYDEVPGSKIKEITVQGNRATVVYIEPDEDREKLRLNRQKGKWKVSAPMPAVALP
jgi:hypothetical protein